MMKIAPYFSQEASDQRRFGYKVEPSTPKSLTSLGYTEKKQTSLDALHRLFEAADNAFAKDALDAQSATTEDIENSATQYGKWLKSVYENNQRIRENDGKAIYLFAHALATPGLHVVKYRGVPFPIQGEMARVKYNEGNPETMQWTALRLAMDIWKELTSPCHSTTKKSSEFRLRWIINWAKRFQNQKKDDSKDVKLKVYKYEEASLILLPINLFQSILSKLSLQRLTKSIEFKLGSKRIPIEILTGALLRIALYQLCSPHTLPITYLGVFAKKANEMSLDVKRALLRKSKTDNLPCALLQYIHIQYNPGTYVPTKIGDSDKVTYLTETTTLQNLKDTDKEPLTLKNDGFAAYLNGQYRDLFEKTKK